MPQIRKRPKPADDAPEPVAQAVVVPAPAQPPPVNEYKPPMVNEGMVLCPRTPEEIIHNVMVRQLLDDERNPPANEPPNQALVLWREIQTAKDEGKPLDVYVERAAKVFQGLEAEERLAAASARFTMLRKLLRQMESDEHVDRFLHRCVQRGDLTAREAIIFKQLNVAELRKTIEDLLSRLEGEQSSAVFTPQEDMPKMDYTVQVTEQTTTRQLEGTTPQGREIVRKITFRARRKLFESQIPK